MKWSLSLTHNFGKLAHIMIILLNHCARTTQIKQKKKKKYLQTFHLFFSLDFSQTNEILFATSIIFCFSFFCFSIFSLAFAVVLSISFFLYISLSLSVFVSVSPCLFLFPLLSLTLSFTFGLALAFSPLLLLLLPFALVCCSLSLS